MLGLNGELLQVHVGNSSFLVDTSQLTCEWWSLGGLCQILDCDPHSLP